MARDYTNAITLFEAYQRDYPGSVHEGKVNEYLELCNKALEQRGTVLPATGDEAGAIRCCQPFLREFALSQWADDALMRMAVI